MAWKAAQMESLDWANSAVSGTDVSAYGAPPQQMKGEHPRRRSSSSTSSSRTLNVPQSPACDDIGGQVISAVGQVWAQILH